MYCVSVIKSVSLFSPTYVADIRDNQGVTHSLNHSHNVFSILGINVKVCQGTTGWRTKCHTGWRTKCHTIDCARNTFLLLQKHLTSGTELILIGWKIAPNEEYVQCDHRFASQPLAN